MNLRSAMRALSAFHREFSYVSQARRLVSSRGTALGLTRASPNIGCTQQPTAAMGKAMAKQWTRKPGVLRLVGLSRQRSEAPWADLAGLPAGVRTCFT